LVLLDKNRFKPVWLGFFRFGSVFRLGFGSVRFGFFGFMLIKPKPNRTEPVDFFKILIGLIGFFSWFGFFGYFFLFSRFNRFFSYFAYPYLTQSNFQRFCGIDESTIVIFKNIFGLF